MKAIIRSLAICFLAFLVSSTIIIDFAVSEDKKAETNNDSSANKVVFFS